MWLRPFESLSLFLFIVILVSVTHGIAQTPTVRFVDREGETLAELEFTLHQEIVYLPVETLKIVFDPEMTHPYDHPRKQLTLKIKGKQLRLRMGNTTVKFDSGKQTFTLTAPPLVIQGRPMLPIDFFQQILPHLDDVKVLYNANLLRVRIIPKTAWIPETPDNTREWTIVIDPGHGGEDDLGCKSQDGFLEKDIVLNMAKEIKIRSAQHGFSVHLTRDQDVKQTSIHRVQTANRNQGQLFLSLHCNASFTPKHKGMRLYINNPNGQIRSKTTSMPVFGKKRLNILTQANFLEQSRDFADVLRKELNFLVEDPIITTEFPIITLANVHMPAVLLELGYLSNIDDAKQLANPNHIAELAETIIRAIQIYSSSENQSSNPNGF